MGVWRADRQDLQRKLARVALDQEGVFTAAQAKKAGYSHQAQHYQVERGNWQRLNRGMFRMSVWPRSSFGDCARWGIWSGGLGVISHETALSVHLRGTVADPIHLTVPKSF